MSHFFVDQLVLLLLCDILREVSARQYSICNVAFWSECGYITSLSIIKVALPWNTPYSGGTFGKTKDLQAELTK